VPYVRETGAVKVLLHIHSSASFDSRSRPVDIAAEARRLGASAVAVTDHDTMAGSLEMARIAPDLQCIPGAEYRSDCGDIIGLFLRDEIRVREAGKLIAAIREQGGVAILPHPWHAHDRVRDLAGMVDALEVWNSRCSAAENAKALALAGETGKPQLAGSDAHFVSEIRNAVMEIDIPGPLTPGDLLHSPRRWTAVAGRRSLLFWSQAIKAVKQRRPAVALAASRGLAGCVLRKVIGNDRWERWKQAGKKR
jgi:predicted metal-dependent phosphoesterase TrpH